MTEQLQNQWESPRKKELRRKLVEYAIFDAMIDAAAEGEFSREDAIKSLRSEAKNNE